MKKILKRLASCLMTMILTFFILYKATDLLQVKSSDYKYTPFFEHAEDYDVLFMGTSHVINAVFPMEIWNSYGITSYNFGGHSNQLATTYWVMQNALDYSTPKVMVIDCLALASNQKTSDNFSYVHLSLDTFPISKTKVKAAIDLLNDESIQKKLDEGTIVESEKRTKMGILWDYSVYHTRWNGTIGENEFEQTSTPELGAESRIQIAQPACIAEKSNDVLSEETVGARYLKKMIEKCKENNIDVVLTYLPFPVSSGANWIEANTVKKIADEYNVAYINFLEENIIDYRTDCYDASSHLNPAGAFKISAYLGEYLHNNYNLDDHRKEVEFEHWKDDYRAYQQYKDNRLATIGDLNTYLMLLEDDCYGYVISVGDNSIFQDKVTINLLKNKGVDVSQICDTTKLIVVCGQDADVINDNVDLNGKVYAGIQFWQSEEGNCSGYLDTSEVFVFDNNELDTQAENVMISVFNREDRYFVDEGTFAIDKQLGIEERYPDGNGIIVMTSKAIRK